jgi:hypothetical protein
MFGALMMASRHNQSTDQKKDRRCLLDQQARGAGRPPSGRRPAQAADPAIDAPTIALLDLTSDRKH